MDTQQPVLLPERDDHHLCGSHSSERVILVQRGIEQGEPPTGFLNMTYLKSRIFFPDWT